MTVIVNSVNGYEVQEPGKRRIYDQIILKEFPIADEMFFLC